MKECKYMIQNNSVEIKNQDKQTKSKANTVM